MVRAKVPSIPNLFGVTALCMAVGVGAAILVGGTITLVAPSPAQAMPAYAQRDGTSLREMPRESGGWRTKYRFRQSLRRQRPQIAGEK